MKNPQNFGDWIETQVISGRYSADILNPDLVDNNDATREEFDNAYSGYCDYCEQCEGEKTNVI